MDELNLAQRIAIWVLPVLFATPAILAMSLIVTMDSVHPFLLLQNGLYAVSEYRLSLCL